jgi:hypothetical protein
MTIQNINIGNKVNDGLGDDLRTAFEKVNSNFIELGNSLTITAVNAAGNNGEGIFQKKDGNELFFKNLVAGNKITLEGFSDSIRIGCDQPDAFTRIDTNIGFVEATAHRQITIQGGDNVRVTASNQVITVDTRDDINGLFSTFDFGPINTLYENIVQLSFSAANIDLGTISNPGTFYLNLGNI